MYFRLNGVTSINFNKFFWLQFFIVLTKKKLWATSLHRPIVRHTYVDLSSRFSKAYYKEF